jgi:hypothetical protein
MRGAVSNHSAPVGPRRAVSRPVLTIGFDKKQQVRPGVSPGLTVNSFGGAKGDRNRPRPNRAVSGGRSGSRLEPCSRRSGAVFCRNWRLADSGRLKPFQRGLNSFRSLSADFLGVETRGDSRENSSGQTLREPRFRS